MWNSQERSAQGRVRRRTAAASEEVAELERLEPGVQAVARDDAKQAVAREWCWLDDGLLRRVLRRVVGVGRLWADEQRGLLC